MAFLRLLINGGSFLSTLSSGRIDKRIWWLIDGFKDRMDGSEMDREYEGLCTVVFFGINSKSEFIDSLELLCKEQKIRSENLEFLLDYFGSTSKNKLIGDSIKSCECGDFDVYLDDLEDEDSLNRIFDSNSSYQFIISEGKRPELSSYERDWLAELKSEELIVADMFLFRSDEITSELFFARSILEYLNRIKDFFILNDIRRVLFLFNSYGIGELMTDELEDMMDLAKSEFENGLFGSCNILLINLNENGRREFKAGKEEKVKGVFHKRQLMTTRLRARFDTRAEIKSDWNNEFEMHPLYYDFDGSRKTGRNQFRGVHLPFFIYYLKKVLPKTDKNVTKFLESMECIKRFEEAYGNSVVLQRRYKTELNFKRVKIYLLES